MGGIIIVLTVIATVLIVSFSYLSFSQEFLLLLLVMVGFGVVGFF